MSEASDGATGNAAEPRWIADEMLGRLARYLRIVGHDTVYVRGVSDGEIVERARREGRRLVTRDRDLARRAEGLLLTSPDIREQLRAVHAAAPGVPFVVRFLRCTECNGRLQPAVALGPSEVAQVPARVVSSGGTVFRCDACGHLYWEGSHVTQIRAHLAEWLG
jgi:uncharacterized protein with PIN domain